MIKVDLNSSVKNIWTQKKLQKIGEKIALKEKKIKGDVEINIIGDKEMINLNYHYRGKKKPTDVLSFAWQEDKKIETNFLGQIYICLPQIKRQAKEYKITEDEELTRMLIHGLLHLVGHDHMNEKQAKKMFKLQEDTIVELGYESHKFI